MSGASWPVLRRYSGAELARIAMPVGGIGTGCVSLGGRGQLVDWELFNRPAKGFTPDSFFCLHTEPAPAAESAGPAGSADGPAPPPRATSGSHTRALEIGLLEAEYAGHSGSTSALHGLPRFADGEFAAAYPFGQVRMWDPQLPVEATVRAFNPLIPGDADASGLPVLVYRAHIRNTSAKRLTVSVCGNLQNVIGREAPAGLPGGNRFERVELGTATVLAGSSTEVARDSEAWGTLALAAIGDPVSSHRLTWARRSWGDSLLDFWDDFSADGQLGHPDGADVDGGARVPTGSLVVTKSLAPGRAEDFTFVLAWHFPGRRAWSHRFRPAPRYGYGEAPVGNHYTTRFADAVDVVRALAPVLPDLEERTRAYVETITSSDLPAEVQDAVLSNTAVLKSPTCFRAADGTFLAWEGVNADHGSCHGSCTHVWNYQYALEQLFPDLAWTMRDVEFRHALDERGMMSFRAGLPLASEGTGWRVAAADGQMGALVRFHRTWQLTGRDDLLARYWPALRRAMEFAWTPLGWDADGDGVMEGCQHSTTDVEYYGPSGVNQSWYLAALAACAVLARAAGDAGFAERCETLLASGAARTDAWLFNGEYYEQRVIPAKSVDHIAEGLRIRHDGDNPDVGSDDVTDPDLQIGPGCTSDQLVGHGMALLGGLDDRLDAAHTAQAMRSVVRHNHRDGFHDHFNHLRSFALGAEQGLLNCTYPRGGRPKRPFPYCNEVWTGLEYSAAVTLAAQGERESALRVVAGVRGRHTGRARNPFDEAECGSHYVRSMASFGLVHGWTRLVFDAAAHTVELDPVPGRWPVVAGGTVGLVEITDGGGEGSGPIGAGGLRARWLTRPSGTPPDIRLHPAPAPAAAP